MRFALPVGKEPLTNLAEFHKLEQRTVTIGDTGKVIGKVSGLKQMMDAADYYLEGNFVVTEEIYLQEDYKITGRIKPIVKDNQLIKIIIEPDNQDKKDDAVQS